VIALDTNVLVYAHRREGRDHARALAVVRGLAEGEEPWGVPWPCAYEFYSVVTNIRIWRDAASTPAQAWHQVEQWLRAPGARLLGETDGFVEILAGLVGRRGVRGPVIHDVRIAAICLAHGVQELLTRDRDFAIVPELSTRDPLR